MKRGRQKKKKIDREGGVMQVQGDRGQKKGDKIEGEDGKERDGKKKAETKVRRKEGVTKRLRQRKMAGRRIKNTLTV